MPSARERPQWVEKSHWRQSRERPAWVDFRTLVAIGERPPRQHLILPLGQRQIDPGS